MEKKSIKFPRNDKAKFFRTLKTRINTYFNERGIKKTGNWKLYFKAIIVLTLFLGSYALLLTIEMPMWVRIIFVIIMGIGMAGVGMNVMHDANHDAFSDKKWINRIMGSSIFILAGNVYNWQVQHNVLHHTYTNVHGHDEDIKDRGILRFSKHAQWFRKYKLQKYYSVFLYGLLTINWAIIVDFKQMKRYLERKLSYGPFPNPKTEWIILIVSKIFYYVMWIVLPLIILDIVWWKILLGFFLMHYVAGLILSIVFQLAHVVPHTETVVPNAEGNLQHTWAIHQLYTTSNFAPNNKFVNWYTGGLNHQVEHHLFPHISHVHYGKLSKIVKETAHEFGLPYYEYKTMRKAIMEHFKQLETLGLSPA